jgi:DNA-directed RNA polymerase subunit N (RpoN/RPB10)
MTIVHSQRELDDLIAKRRACRHQAFRFLEPALIRCEDCGQCIIGDDIPAFFRRAA